MPAYPGAVLQPVRADASTIVRGASKVNSPLKCPPTTLGGFRKHHGQETQIVVTWKG